MSKDSDCKSFDSCFVMLMYDTGIWLIDVMGK
jgi:hypothetical protein